jgi:MFS family permease
MFSVAHRLTVPPYALGCIFTVMIGTLSDRVKMRGPFVMGCSLLAIVGYSMLYATSPKKLPGVGYTGAILAACGVFPTVPLMLAWGSGNAGGSLKRAVVIGLLSGVGNLGGYGTICKPTPAFLTLCCRICSSFIYRTKDVPRFHLGHGIVLGFLCVAFVASAAAIYIYNRLNEAKEAKCIAEGIDVSRKAEFSALGCNSPLFRYVYFATTRRKARHLSYVLSA